MGRDNFHVNIYLKNATYTKANMIIFGFNAASSAGRDFKKLIENEGLETLTEVQYSN